MSPMKPKHPCRYPGCGRLAPSGQSYCEAHQKNAYPRRRRDSQTFYAGSQWRKLRRMFLRANPVCAVPGCGKSAEIVNHKIDRKDRPELAYAWDNLEALCKEHHDKLRIAYTDKNRTIDELE